MKFPKNPTPGQTVSKHGLELTWDPAWQRWVSKHFMVIHEVSQLLTYFDGEWRRVKRITQAVSDDGLTFTKVNRDVVEDD